MTDVEFNSRSTETAQQVTQYNPRDRPFIEETSLRARRDPASISSERSSVQAAAAGTAMCAAAGIAACFKEWFAPVPQDLKDTMPRDLRDILNEKLSRVLAWCSRSRTV